MRQVTLAVVQMSPQLAEPEANLNRMVQLIQEIGSTEKTDLIIFPELCVTGYECGVRFTDLAEAVPGHVSLVLGKKAAEFNVHVAFGMVERKRAESTIYDCAVLLGPDGEIVDKYHKVHLWGEEKLAFRPGYQYPLMETAMGRLGLVLGWDLAFPEVARTYALRGAEVLCVLANWEKDKAAEWSSYLAARAYENAVFVAAANRVGKEYTYTFAGESGVVGPRGEILAQVTGEADSFGIARIDLDDVKRVQEDFQFFQSRQPQSYREIVRMY
jgi:omega-amidase